MVLLSVCTAVAVVRRHKYAAKLSASNAEIHNKYQDTSLQVQAVLQSLDKPLCVQISGRQYDTGRADSPSGELERVQHETSFSVTEPSWDGLEDGETECSQGSTALVQDCSDRQLNYTLSSGAVSPPSPGDTESLAEEYTAEPSRTSWKRRRRSEEIL